MSEYICKVEIREGSEETPAVIKIKFSQETWNFFVPPDRYACFQGRDKENQASEISEAIHKACYYIRREMLRAAKEQLGIVL